MAIMGPKQYDLGFETKPRVQPKGLYPDVLDVPPSPPQRQGELSLGDLFRMGSVQVEGPRPTEEEAISQLRPSPAAPLSDEEIRIGRESSLQDLLADAMLKVTTHPEYARSIEPLQKELGGIQAAREMEKERASRERMPGIQAQAQLQARRDALKSGVVYGEREIEEMLKRGTIDHTMAAQLNMERERFRQMPLSSSGIGMMFRGAELDDPAKRKQLFTYLGITNLLSSGQGLIGVTTVLGQLLKVMGVSEADQGNFMAQIMAAIVAEMYGGQPTDYLSITTKGGKAAYRMKFPGMALGAPTPTAQGGGGWFFGTPKPADEMTESVSTWP